MYTKQESEISLKSSVTKAIQKTNFVTSVSELRVKASVDFANTTSVPALDTPTITNLVLSALEGVQSGVPTRTTATLTPTTLRNIEQLLETPSVSPPEIHSNQAGFVPPPVLSSASNTFVDNKTWGGGIVTLNSVKDSAGSTNAIGMPSVSPPLNNSTPEVTPRRTGGRRPANTERLSPEEEGRRYQRRERNKEAAARCRKRRLDQTNNLQEETDELEDKKSSLRKEIEILQRQKDELEYLLNTHEPSCKRIQRIISTNAIKAESATIKSESYETIVEPLTSKYQSSEPVMPNAKKRSSYPQRPTSLAVAPLSKGVSEIGVAIDTPSNALRGFGMTLDSIMEVGTGLTPVSTGLTPITSNVSMGLSSGMGTLNTPIIATSNCGSQQRTSSCDLSSPDAVPPKLVSL